MARPMLWRRAMIKSVLVYIDGSSSSKAATLAAIKIAREQKANLVGMAIVHEPGVHAGRSTRISGSSFEYIRDKSQLVDASTRAAGWLATFESHCRSAGVPVEVLKIVGRPAESLLAEIERHDLTLIGSEADFQFETARDIRSTREKILRRAIGNKKDRTPWPKSLGCVRRRPGRPASLGELCNKRSCTVARSPHCNSWRRRGKGHGDRDAGGGQFARLGNQGDRP